MNLHKMLLPDFLLSHIKSYIIFNTSEVTTLSGKELRIAHNYIPRRRYVLDDLSLSQNEFKILYNFFYARCGKRFGFYLLDPIDFKLTNHKLEKFDNSDNKFKIVKKYGDDKNYYLRDINNIDDKNIKLYINGEIISDELMNDVTIIGNIIDIPDIISQDVDVTIDCNFYTPIRFENDLLEYQYSDDNTIKLKQINMIELL